MALDQALYEAYIAILKEELVPALGCTEPIALAYASAKAAQLLGGTPERIVARCSGNIIKNVKGVVVPGTDGLRGIETAVLLGAVGGDADKELEVLQGVTAEDLAETKRLLAQKLCEVELLQTKAKLHIIVEMFSGAHRSLVEIVHSHTGIVRLEQDDRVLLSIPFTEETVEANQTDPSCLNVRSIVAFANEVRMEDVEPILLPQIQCNSAISQHGLSHPYGACIGRTLLETCGTDVRTRARAAAAAGSDARMGGCEMPVIINSGSGNQGMTVSLPVIEYAKELGASQETLCRALCVSNLIAIHQKASIGRLSAYCGAVSAAAGAGAAITYLYGGSVEDISTTISNTLANVAGIVCDGAKASCAAKIATSVDAAILAHSMTMRHAAFHPGQGIVLDTIEQTIEGVAKLARAGMQHTDTEILGLLVGC